MYVEAFGAATLIDGVLRVETLYRNAKGETVSAGELVIPAARIAALSDGLGQIVARIQPPAEAASEKRPAGRAATGAKAR